MFKAFTNSSALAYSEPDNPNAAKHLPNALELQFSNALVLFIKVFAQVGVLFRSDDGKFTGDMNYPEAGGAKGLIGWINESGNILSGYKNEPRPKQPKAESKEIPF